MQVFPETRYHRCAVYAWGALQGAQAPTVPPAARLVLPKSMPLNDQFAAWHEAAEAFCQRAVREALPLLSEKLRDQRGPPPGLLPSQSGAVSWKLWSCVVGVVCTARPQSKSAAGLCSPAHSRPMPPLESCGWCFACVPGRGSDASWSCSL